MQPSGLKRNAEPVGGFADLHALEEQMRNLRLSWRKPVECLQYDSPGSRRLGRIADEDQRRNGGLTQNKWSTKGSRSKTQWGRLRPARKQNRTARREPVSAARCNRVRKNALQNSVATRCQWPGACPERSASSPLAVQRSPRQRFCMTTVSLPSRPNTAWSSASSAACHPDTFAFRDPNW